MKKMSDWARKAQIRRTGNSGPDSENAEIARRLGYEMTERSRLSVRIEVYHDLEETPEIEWIRHCRSFTEAQQKYCARRDGSGMGASQWGDGMVFDEFGQHLARISYNGRLWEPTQWRPHKKVIAEAPAKIADADIDLPVWHYSGDVNLEHGGVFFQISEFEDMAPAAMEGLAYAVSVQPHPEEEDTWIVQNDGQVFIDPGKMDQALRTCGYELSGDGILDGQGAVITGQEAALLVFDAFHAYHGIENAITIHVDRKYLEDVGMSLEAWVRDAILSEPYCTILRPHPEKTPEPSPGF